MVATFIQILRSVICIGNVVLDKSVPTPFPSSGILGTYTVKLSCQGQSETAGTCFTELQGEGKA